MKNHLYRLFILFVFGISSNILVAKTNSTMKEKNSYPMFVDTTELLVSYDITYCRLDLACGQMPDTTQENIILCTAAAFTGKCLNYFEHSNILGAHISNGVLYEGYTEDKDGIPYAERYALFIWNGMKKDRLLAKGFYPISDSNRLLQTTERGGMAFTQHWAIKNRQIFLPSIQTMEQQHYFRAMCQKDNRFYVIESREKVAYREYLQMLLDYGVENALYMDMGRGWNHAFYRDSANKLHILHPKAHDYCTNWLVVYLD